MTTGAPLDLEIAAREVREAEALLARARARVIHAHTLGPLPPRVIEAAGGLITAASLCEISAGILVSALPLPPSPKPARSLAELSS